MISQISSFRPLFHDQYLDSLEARLKEAALKNSTLLNENTSLRKQVSLLEKEVSTFMYVCVYIHIYFTMYYHTLYIPTYIQIKLLTPTCPQYNSPTNCFVSSYRMSRYVCPWVVPLALLSSLPSRSQLLWWWWWCFASLSLLSTIIGQYRIHALMLRCEITQEHQHFYTVSWST